MLRKNAILTLAVIAVGLLISVPPTTAQQIVRNYDDYRDYDRARIDRYLDVEIWTNHSDGEYYEGDNIVLHYRTNRDAFVAIYSIDTKGRVNLLFPSRPGEDNYIKGGVTYRLPGGLDDFDLVVTGPEGVENIQIIASRERFPIPDWYPTSGLVCDWDDRFEYMDYLNERYFIRYDGQRFSYDRTAIYVEEWEQYYFRPVYNPDYYPWTIYGNVYIDYPFGATIYIDGIYWGVAPLYIPRIYVGWHYITVYDYYGYCWEAPIHITRYNTVVLDNTIIRTSPTVVSKYKEVRFAGYRNPVTNGYPHYEKKTKAILKAAAVDTKIAKKDRDFVSKKTATFFAGAKKYVRGTPKLVKTDKGYETTGPVYQTGKGWKAKGYNRSKTTYTGKAKVKQKGGDAVESRGKSRSGKYQSTGGWDFPKAAVVGKEKSSGKKSYQKSKTKGKAEKPGYYLKKSGPAFKGKSGSKRSKSKEGKSYKGHKKSKGGKAYNMGKATGRSKGSASIYRGSGGKFSGRSSSSMGGRSSGGRGALAGGKSSRGASRSASKGKR
jgi:hypothetical protein